MRKSILKSTLLSLLAILVASLPVLAAYSALIQVTTTTTSYDMLPVLVDTDNDYLVANNYIDADGRDVQIQSAGVGVPRLLGDDKTLFSAPMLLGSTINYQYTTDNAPADFSIIAGCDGYVTTGDAAALELGGDFEIESEAYFDLDKTETHPLQKQSAAGITISDTDELSGIIYFDEPVDVSPVALGAWTDIDISEYVPDYATGAVVQLYTSNTVEIIGVRINGSAQELRGDIYGHIWTMVGIDAGDILEGYIEAATCHIYLVGFTGSGVTYKVVADDVSLGAALAWTDIDLAAEAPGATGVIIGVDNTAAAVDDAYGLRKNGSADARITGIQRDGWYYGIVGCDASQIIEGYVGALTTDFYLVGYITDDFTFNTNATDKSLAAGFAAWTDIDCNAATSDITTHIIFEVVANQKDYGFRRNGSVENIHPEMREHCWVVVECDSDQIVEMWAEDATVDCYIIGYTEGYIDSPYQLSVIANGLTPSEMVVTQYGVANEPQWATGDVLHFDGTANSNINCGAIYNASVKLWVSLWFCPDANFFAGVGANQFIWGKVITANDMYRLFLWQDTGQLRLEKITGGVADFQILSTEVSWNEGEWHNVIFSISDVAAVRMVIDSGVAITDIDTSAAPNGGNFTIGDWFPGAGQGFIGEIQNVISGTDDLTVGEETDLYAGIAPGDETGYYYIDEGTGATIYDYGTLGADGTAGVATAWQTSTYTAGQTGRLCDFTIDVDGDRWGKNLKGISVPDTDTTDWQFMLKNGVPYMNYYKHTVSGVLIVNYQPDDIISGTTLPDLEGAAQNGTFTWGTNPADISYTLGGMVSTDITIPVTAETPQDIIPSGYTPSLWGMTAPVNAFSPFVESLASAVNVPDVIMWVVISFFFIGLVMVGLYIKFQNILIAGLVGAFLMVALSVIGILPQWTILLAVLLITLPVMTRERV